VKKHRVNLPRALDGHSAAELARAFTEYGVSRRRS
jgi:hypothetical protein